MIRQLRKRIFIGRPASQQTLSAYTPPSDNVTSVINDSFFNGNIIEIEYFSGKHELTIRQVEPSFILLSWPIWYVMGWDYLRQDFRVFRIDRISKCEKIDKKMPSRNYDDLMEIYKQYFESL